MVSSSRDRGDSPATGLGQFVSDRPVADRPAGDLSEAPEEDAEIVKAARNGDRNAFGRLYDRHARMVHGILLTKVPFADVDDLVHDTFVKALRKLSTLRDNGSFGPWLAAIARNLANDHYRRRAPETPLEEEFAAAEAGASPEPAVSGASVLEAIRNLPESYREPLILRLVEGMTGPEIAARTGLTPGSVRVNLHRGMQHLRASLKLPAQKDPCNEGTT
jgi:RNA polymerase sigma-70 factor, ECF subfamily